MGSKKTWGAHFGEGRDQKTSLVETLCWRLGRLGPEAVLGGGQCSQLISSLSGCALSELISFVERDNESVFRPMNLGRSGSDGLLATLFPPSPGPFYMLSTLRFFWREIPSSIPNSQGLGPSFRKAFLQSNSIPSCCRTGGECPGLNQKEVEGRRGRKKGTQYTTKAFLGPCYLKLVLTSSPSHLPH